MEDKWMREWMDGGEQKVADREMERMDEYQRMNK